jgi:HEAT repeat protein
VNLLSLADRFADQAVRIGVLLTIATAVAVVVERAVCAIALIRRRRIARRYAPIIARALAGDEVSAQQLAASPRAYRMTLAQLLIVPLYSTHDEPRIVRTRTILRRMALAAVAERLLKSRWWWRRVLALRAVGILRSENRTADLVAALDDEIAEVRATALDALADLHAPAALPSVVVRLHDESLHRGRRLAAIAAYGSAPEPFLLDIAAVDPANRLNYARALGICGTRRSLPTLCGWAQAPDMALRAAAFQALGRVGLDGRAASLAIDALESDDVSVRAMAAFALHDWSGPGDAAGHLARHLDDSWPVAVSAARSLKSMHQAGMTALQASISRPGLAGQLARQTLWEIAAR